MDLATCLKKMKLVECLHSQQWTMKGHHRYGISVRFIMSRMHSIFSPPEVKNFCKELMEDGRVQILAYTKYKEMIRLSGKAYTVAENEQKKMDGYHF